MKRASGEPFFMRKCFAQVLYARHDQKKPFHPTTPIVLDKTTPGAKLTIQYFGWQPGSAGAVTRQARQAGCGRCAAETSFGQLQ
ncbi:MAG: hypothetical protein H7Z39_20480 [Burkholderiaceae bacterium]|nr:hypothetical protein [Burkholderiaceae bacterium]